MRRALGLCLLLAAAGLACGDESTEPTPQPLDPPRAPRDLTPVETSPAAITLSWRDAATDETGFRIERAVTGTGQFTAAGTVGADVQVFVDRGVTAETSYTYRVFALRNGADSEPSGTVDVRATRNAAPVVPHSPAPADRFEDLDPNTAVVLAWEGNDPDGDALTYDVYFGSSRSALTRISAGQTTTEFPLTATLARNRTYFWQVVTRDPVGLVRRSPVWVFSTVVDRDDVPEGYFIMGSPAGTQFEHPGNPIPARAFNIDRFEVTNAQYVNYLNQARVLGEVRVSGGVVYDITGLYAYCDVYPDSRRSTIGDEDSAILYSRADSLFDVREGWENFPVIQVSWYGARAYAEFRGRRLPTEAEWEKAARGTSNELGEMTFQLADSTLVIGIGYPFPWGTEPEPNRGNFDNSGDPFENQGRVRTTPVGYYDGSVRGGYATASGASPYGCFDLAGNVWEWVADSFEPYHDPHDPPVNELSKVIRGGDFERGIGSATVWNRSAVAPAVRDRAIGFRTVGDGLLGRIR